MKGVAAQRLRERQRRRDRRAAADERRQREQDAAKEERVEEGLGRPVGRLGEGGQDRKAEVGEGGCLGAGQDIGQLGEHAVHVLKEEAQGDDPPLGAEEGPLRGGGDEGSS